MWHNLTQILSNVNIKISFLLEFFIMYFPNWHNNCISHRRRTAQFIGKM